MPKCVCVCVCACTRPNLWLFLMWLLYQLLLVGVSPAPTALLFYLLHYQTGRRASSTPFLRSLIVSLGVCVSVRARRRLEPHHRLQSHLCTRGDPHLLVPSTRLTQKGCLLPLPVLPDRHHQLTVTAADWPIIAQSARLHFVSSATLSLRSHPVLPYLFVQL